MKKLIKPMTFFFLFSLLFLPACQKNTDTPIKKDSFFRENAEIQVKMRLEERWEKVCFVLKDDSLTLSFSDPESPLFQMTEVVTEDFVETSFEGISYKSRNSLGFSGIIYKVIDLLEEEPAETKREKDYFYKTFVEEDFTFTIKETKTGAPVSLSGECQNHSFEIKFEKNT